MPPGTKKTRNESKKTDRSADVPVLPSSGPSEEIPYADIFKSSPQDLCAWRIIRDKRGDPVDLEIVAANQGFLRYFGIPDLVGGRASEFDPHYLENSPNILEIAARVSTTGKTESHELFHPRLNTWVHFNVSAVPNGMVVAHAYDTSRHHAAQSELERAQYSLDKMEDFATWSDSTGRIVQVAESACRKLEYTRDELLGMTVFDVTPSVDREQWARSWRELKPSEFFRTEVEHRTKSGHTFPAELTVHCMSFEGQEYHCTFSRDITDRKQTEADVRRVRYSLDQMDDYPTWNDSQGRIIEVSESTCRHLEYSREELLGMTIFDIVPDIDVEDWRRSWEDSGLTGFRLESHHRTKSGRVFPVELMVNPMEFEGVRYHCTFCRDISERKQLEESLALTRLSVEHAPDMIHWLDAEGRITYANRSMCEFLGYTLEELQSMHISEVSPTLPPEEFAKRWANAAENAVHVSDETWVTKDNREVAVDISATHVRQGDAVMGLAFVRDVTERKQAERSLRESEERYRELFDAQTETVKTLRERDEQLLQAQKMEAIGRLAGGIAHDFNNVLTTIIGYSDLILSSPECPEGPLAEDIAEIKDAAQRASSLTQRVLAFSRRQAMQPTVLSLNDVVSDTERLLARTIGADIELSTTLAPGLAKVEVDEQQFVQVLLNLAVNARDAMPQGGALAITTANVKLDEQFCTTHPEVHPGSYVKLTVADTGSGMDPEVLAHVFEPFYTTKPPGQGTGLGLATAYGVVAQSGGCIYVDSEPGRGTTFTVYLPRAEVAAAVTEDDRPTHTIVVVDSDHPFLTLTTRILERQGLKVLPFDDGERATKTLADPSVPVDALLTSATLSGAIQGTRLAELAGKRRPGLPVLFVGADADFRPSDAATAEDLHIDCLEKPFTAEELTQWVRTWLTGPSHDDFVGAAE